MIDLQLRPTDRMLRQFAGAWLIVFGVLAAREWLARGNPRLAMALAGVALLVGLAGLVRPRAVRWLFIASTVAAFPIGWVISQVMLLLLFIVVITPVALLFKLAGRDRLLRKRTKRESYWIPKGPIADVARYLRQY